VQGDGVGERLSDRQSGRGNRTPLPPKAELQWWYQFYFATERGQAGYEANRHDFNKLIWRTASPKWNFDDATYDRSAESFNNPDHVAVVIHNYRWRLGLAQGEPQYDALEARLATAPAISVPAITMEGDANGAPHPEPAAYAKKFTGKYRTGTSTAASDTTCPRKRRRPLPTPSSTSSGSNREAIRPPSSRLSVNCCLFCL
jgi:hypothetical protein